MSHTMLNPMHPGEVLREEFMKPLGLSAYRIAKSIGVPANRIQDIVREKRNITPSTALRLAKFFGNSPEFWMNLQNHYDFEEEIQRSGEELKAIEKISMPA